PFKRLRARFQYISRFSGSFSAAICLAFLFTRIASFCLFPDETFTSKDPAGRIVISAPRNLKLVPGE
ncbi:hypothetical protein ABK046_48385, partial [Streptomyces caeruleatus]